MKKLLSTLKHVEDLSHLAEDGSRNIQSLRTEMTKAAAVQGAIQENVKQIHSGVSLAPFQTTDSLTHMINCVYCKHNIYVRA